MSRGFGRLQNALLATIRHHRKPMTFGDIRAAIRRDLEFDRDVKLRVSFERSLRRALHSMVRDQVFIALGSGGPGDPHRYFLLHPLRLP